MTGPSSDKVASSMIFESRRFIEAELRFGEMVDALSNRMPDSQTSVQVDKISVCDTVMYYHLKDLFQQLEFHDVYEVLA